MFSEKTSAYDAICSTSSASLSRNTPFPQFELTMGEAMLQQSNVSSGGSAAVGVQRSPGAHARELEFISGICKRLLLCSSPTAASLAVTAPL